MAGLTKEERAKRQAEKEEQLRRSIEEQVRSELHVPENDEALRRENNELKKQIAEMMNMIKDLQNGKSVSDEKSSVVANVNLSEPIKDVEMNARILVTSITTGGVNLKTSTDGSARHFRFEKLGQTIPIIYEHLINCINTDRWLFEDGLIYISDKNVIREQCLEDAYRKFLTPQMIENIMDFDVDTIIEMVTSTTPAIQETIVDLVANKMNTGGSIDMNKVNAIGNACGINIMELANKLR